MKNESSRAGVVGSAIRFRALVFGSGAGWLICVVLFLQAGTLAFGVNPPKFIQEKDNQVTSGNTSGVTLSLPVTAGNLIAVYLIWDNTGGASVSDSRGNLYASAVVPIRWSSGQYSAQVFYTVNLSTGADTVTATFATAVNSFGIIYAHEYSGVLATAPIDVTAAAAGASGSLNSGTATTTNVTDLLFAGGVSANTVTSPGPGYIARATAHGNMTEDKVVSAKGSYNATASNSGGAWAMQMVAFKGAASDTTSPTVPTAFSATPLSPSQIGLSWTASTDPDNPQNQLTYGIYRNGMRVGTTVAGAASWTDTGLAPATTYSYTTSASDPATNISAQTPAVQATTPSQSDTTPPSVPNNLSVTGTTSSTVSLSWTPSTDNVGVSGYRIYRGGAQIGTSAATAYTDTGLTPSTTYSYAVSAYDAAGNNSAQSAPVNATTTGGQDTQAPTVSITAPVNNQNVSGTTTVTANAADNVGVAGVQFRLDGGNLGAEVTSPPYSTGWDTTKTANGSHVLTAVARDAAGNKATSSGVTVAVSNGNGSPRPYSTNFPLTENPISEGGNWINGKVLGVDWKDCRTTGGMVVGTQTGAASPPYDDSTCVVAGNWGPDQTAQAVVKITSPVIAEVEIRLRTTISAHCNTGYEFNFRTKRDGAEYTELVRWDCGLNKFKVLTNATHANSGVDNGDCVMGSAIGNVISAYLKRQCNGQWVQIIQFTDSTYPNGAPGVGFYQTNGNAAANTQFGFSSFTASDNGTGDTTPPSVPANLSANIISSSEIDLSWSPSTDNVGVAGYKVFRNNTQIATSPTSSFPDKTVLPGVQYTYTVAAFDAAGNVSAQSAPVIAQTSQEPDITPPSVPANLQPSKITATSLSVGWSPSTDNVAVAGYRIFRNGTQVGTSTATTYADTGLAPSTTYIYTVAAFDTSNNVSAQSQQLPVTTTSAVVTPPSIVQVTQNQVSSGPSTSVTFNTPTVAGNTIVAYVIWDNIAGVTLTDSRGDTFVNVSAPVTWAGGYSAQVFYASNIAGGTDTVTAVFRTPVNSFGVVYIHEYAGISAISPVDVTASASGNSSSLNSGSATTTSPNDLIFGAGVSDNMVTAAGSGFSARDFAFGNITEDQIGVAASSYAATATQYGNSWGMQMVAFRAAQ